MWCNLQGRKKRDGNVSKKNIYIFKYLIYTQYLRQFQNIYSVSKVVLEYILSISGSSRTFTQVSQIVLEYILCISSSSRIHTHVSQVVLEYIPKYLRQFQNIYPSISGSFRIYTQVSLVVLEYILSISGSSRIYTQVSQVSR